MSLADKVRPARVIRSDGRGFADGALKRSKTCGRNGAPRNGYNASRLGHPARINASAYTDQQQQRQSNPDSLHGEPSFSGRRVV
jgi:hypothetical protein